MRQYAVDIGNGTIAVAVGDDGSITIDGIPVVLDIQQVDRQTYSVLINGRSLKIIISAARDSYSVLSGSVRKDVRVFSERDVLLREYGKTQASVHQRSEIHAPMPALVSRVEVAVGDDVTDGQGLLVLEAMKMENEIKAHCAGKVKEIRVTAGTPVERGELLIVLE